MVFHKALFWGHYYSRYISTIAKCLKSTRPKLFADDTNITATNHTTADIESAANYDLENLKDWLKANKLSLNVTKSQFMLIDSPQMIQNASNARLNILIENKQIQQVNKAKTLEHLLTSIYLGNPY